VIKYTLRLKATDRQTFLAIKLGIKSVETRAASKRYKDIEVGDMLVLVCGKDKIEKVVKKTKIFKTIKSLVAVYPVKKIMPELSSEKDLEKMYYSYPSYKEKIKKYGLIALEL